MHQRGGGGAARGVVRGKGAILGARRPHLCRVQQQVQQDRGDRPGRDAGVEDEGEPLGELVVDRRRDGRQQRDAHRDGHDEDVAVVEPHLGEGADAGGGDHSEQGDPRPAEHRARDALDDGRDLRDEPQDDEDAAGRRRHVARPHSGERHETDVLRERGVREGVEDAAEHGAEPVGAETVGELATGHGLLHDLADGDHVAGRLGHDDEADDDHRHDRGELEGRQPEVERCDEGEPARFADSRPVDHARYEEGRDRADDEAEQHRDALERGWPEPFDEDDHDEGADGVGDVDRRRSLGGAIDDPAGGDAHQRQPDDEDDGAGDDRREEPQELREEGCRQQHEQAARDSGAKDRLDALGLTDCDHRPDRGERHALDERQPHPEAPEPDRLDDGGDAGHEEVGADEERQVCRGVPERAADDERHGHRAGVHREDVLQAEREQSRERRDGVDAVRGCAGTARGLLVGRLGGFVRGRVSGHASTVGGGGLRLKRGAELVAGRSRPETSGQRGPGAGPGQPAVTSRAMPAATLTAARISASVISTTCTR